MPSTSAPSDPVGDAPTVGHYDGVSALRRTPRLIVEGGGFRLAEHDAPGERHAFADLIALGSAGRLHRYGLRGRPGWRVDIADPLPAALAAQLPSEPRYGGWLDRTGLWIGVGACAALAAVAIFTLAQLPTLAARVIPAAVEAQLGNAMVGDFGNRTCDAPAGDAALATLVERLGPGARGADIRVVNVPIVNAVTLPGGHVLVFQGLLDKAESADEVAGVIGHELGHVAHRDVVASLIRQLGLSVVLGGLGGDVGGWVNTVLATGYSRAAERAADDYAIDLMRDAAVSPNGVAAFFGRLAKAEPRSVRARTMLGYLATHPLSDERRRRFIASGKGRVDRPVLDARQWADLRAICAADRDVSKTEFRL